MSSPHALLSFISFIQKSPSTHIMASKEASLSNIKLHITHNVRIHHQRHIPHLFCPVGAAPGIIPVLGKEVVVGHSCRGTVRCALRGFPKRRGRLSHSSIYFPLLRKSQNLNYKIKMEDFGMVGYNGGIAEGTCVSASRKIKMTLSADGNESKGVRTVKLSEARANKKDFIHPLKLNIADAGG